MRAGANRRRQKTIYGRMLMLSAAMSSFVASPEKSMASWISLAATSRVGAVCSAARKRAKPAYRRSLLLGAPP